MPADSQNISVVFDGNEIGGIVSLSVDGVSADYVEVTTRTDTSRCKRFRPADVDYGTVSITCRNPGMTQADVGAPTSYQASLQVSQGGGTLFSARATLQSFAWTATVGELQEYRIVFKIEAE